MTQFSPASSNDPAQTGTDPFAGLQQSAEETSSDPWHGLDESAADLKQQQHDQFQAYVTQQTQQRIQQEEAQRGAPLSVADKFGMESAVRESVLGPGGNIVQPIDQANAQVANESAKTNTFLQNFGTSAINAATSGGVALARPFIGANNANAVQQNIQSAYGQAEQGSVGDTLGNVAGSIAGAAPIVASGPLAPAVMAIQGLGTAQMDVDQQRANGRSISDGDALGYEVASAGLQGLLGYVTGGAAKGASGLLSKAVAKLSPALLDTITASEGRVLVPYVANIMMRAGVGASEAEVLNAAQNIAARISSVDPNRDTTQGALTAGLQGAALAGGHAAYEGPNALPKTPTGVELQPGQEQAEALARLQPPIPGATPGERQSIPTEAPSASPQPRNEAPSDNGAQRAPLNAEPPAALTGPTRLAVEGNPYADVKDEEYADRDASLNDDMPPSGKLMPHDHQVDTDLTKTLESQAKEEPAALPSGNGKLSADAFDHPLIKELRKQDSSVQPAEIPDTMKGDVVDFEKATGKKIVGFTSDKVMGYSHPEIGDSFGINVNNPQESFDNIAAHEWGHTFQDENPEAARQIYDAVPPEQRQQLVDSYLKRYTAQYGADKAREYLQRNGKQEVVSLVIGQGNETNQRVRDAIAQNNPSLWGKIKESVQNFLGKFTAKGRLINAMVEGIRNRVGLSDEGSGGSAGAEKTKAFKQGVSAGQNEGSDEGRLIGRQKAYTEIGHQAEGKADVDLWWKDENGDIQTRKATGRNATHGQAGADEPENEQKGRIDHTNKQISLTDNFGSNDFMLDRKNIATAEQLQRSHPGYDVYVNGKGGMIPLDEYKSGGRFMLSKLGNIVHDEDDVKGFKSKLNQFTPVNGTKFEITPEDRIKRAVFDKEAPLIKMVRTSMNRTADPSKLSPEAYIRLHAGFGETRAQQVDKGLRALNGQQVLDPKTNEPLTRDWLMGPLSESVRAGHGDSGEVLSYTRSIMVAERTLEKASQMKGNRAVTGIGNANGPATKSSDVSEANTFLSQAKTEPAWDNAQEAIRRARLWGNEHIRMAEEAGLISKIQARDIIGQNKFYANTSRVFEDHALIDPNDPGYASGNLHKFRGDDRLINDPFANMMQSTEQLAKRAQENFTKQKIIEAAKPFADLVQPAAKEAKDTIPVMENGTKKFYTVDPEVAHAVNSWGQQTPPALWGALSLPGRLKLLGTLIRPAFQWNHFRKQTQNRIMLGEGAGGFKGVADTVKGFDPATKELLDTLGGTMSHNRDYGTSSNDYFRLVSKTLDGLSKDPNNLLALPGKAWKGYGKLGEWADGFNRIVEYKGALDQAKGRGMNPLDAQTYAAWKARDLMDFSVSGNIVKQINNVAYVPFLNAEVQGLRKVYEGFRDDPVKAASRAALFGLVPAMAPYLWAKSQGKDIEDDYKQTPLAQRIMYYQYHVGNYRVMIPKGQTQAMASAMWEAFLDKHNGDVATWARAMGDSGLVPRPITDPESMIPFQGIRDAVSNYSWFYDKNIVPPDENNLALDLRHTDGASRLGKFLSDTGRKAGWEVDPRKIDHVLSNDFGTSGIDAQTASNIGRDDRPLGTQGLLTYADTRFPAGYTSQSVQDAMKKAEYYGDTQSPQYGAMKTALSGSYAAKTPEERNQLVDEARKNADAATAFYDEHGKDLIAAKEFVQKIDAAVSAMKALPSVAAQREWLSANPEDKILVSAQDRLRVVQQRIGELRKVLASPTVSDSTKTRANTDITRLYGIISTLAK